MRTVYISGPMRGIPALNFPAFNRAAQAWRERGWLVENPAESPGEENIAATWETLSPEEQQQVWHDCMRKDITALLGCDAVALLPGWERSTGACVEVLVAIVLGLEFFDAWTRLPAAVDPVTILRGLPALIGRGRPVRDEPTVLEEAARLVSSDRNQDYGHPLDDFSRTALMWSGLFRDLLRPGATFTAEDVPQAMECVKLSRERTKHKRDNLVDGAGYWATLAMVIDERERRQKEIECATP